MVRQLHRGPAGALVPVVRDRGPAGALVRLVGLPVAAGLQFVAATGGSTGAVSALTTGNIAIPAAVQAGDLALVVAGNERDLIWPTVNFPTAGFVSARGEVGGTNAGTRMGWKRIAAGDLGGSMSADLSSTRRMSMAVVFFRGAADPVFTNGAAYNGAARAAQIHPNATPAVNNSRLVSLLTTVNAAATFTADAAWTERAEYGSTNAGTNAYSYIADRLLTGGAGVSQTGHTVTASVGTTPQLLTTVVVAPA